MTGVTDTLDAAVDAGCFVRSSGNTVWWGDTERVDASTPRRSAIRLLATRVSTHTSP